MNIDKTASNTLRQWYKVIVSYRCQTDHIVTLLIAERDRLNAAIEVLSGTTTKRRGRPPGSKNGASAAAASVPTVKRVRIFTAAQRKQQAARMKKHWTEKKTAKKG
jgi:hypothetical protein